MPHRAKLAALFAVTVAVPAAAADYPIVAQWNMDETDGTVMVDSSGNGNNGTTYDVVLSDEGYVFNGTSSRAVVPSSATLNPGTRDFSFSAQVKTDRIPPLGTDYDILRKGTSVRTGGEYKLEIVYNRGVGKAYCVVHDALGNVATIRGKTNVTDGQLHTLTCTKTATSLTLNVDSLAPQVKLANVPGPISNKKALTIGVKATGITGAAGDWYYGTIRSATVTMASDQATSAAQTKDAFTFRKPKPKR